MGIFDADDFPDFQAPAMNPEHKKFIDDTIDRQDQGKKEAFDRSNKALETSSGLLPSRENSFRSEAAMGRNNKAQTDAILKKGENLFSKNIREMMIQNQIKAQQERMNSLSNKYQLTSRQWKLFEEIKQAKMLAEANKIAARNAVIGQVFQVAGTVVGAMVGGPMGAAAGSQIGGAIAPKQSGPNVNRGSSQQSRRTPDGNGLGDYNDRMRNQYDTGDF